MNELPRELFKHWVHSREEDAHGVTVYRPSTYNFPPARGREGFEIRPDGQFVRYGIAAADGSRAVMGRWKAEGPDRVVVRIDEGKPFILEILSCDETMLQLKEVTWTR